MDYLAARFPEPLKTAFAAWLATNPEHQRRGPVIAVRDGEYQIPELAAAKAADHRPTRSSRRRWTYNQRGDNYTLLTVAFASVLFFAAISDG